MFALAAVEFTSPQQMHTYLYIGESDKKIFNGIKVVDLITSARYAILEKKVERIDAWRKWKKYWREAMTI